MGADSSVLAKFFISLHKNFNINIVLRSFRSFSVNEGNVDFDVPKMARPNMEAVNGQERSKYLFSLHSIWLDFFAYPICLRPSDCIGYT